MRRISLVTVCVLAATVAACVPSAYAAPMDTWSGNTDGTWNTTNNWSAGVPGSGDDLVFPASPHTLGTTDQITGLSANSVTIQDPLYSFGVASGATLGLGAGGITTSFSVGAGTGVAWDIPLTLSANQAWNFGTDSAVRFNGTVDLGANTLTIQGAGSVNLEGVISGGGGLDITGSFAAFDADNVFTGPVQVTGGEFIVGGNQPQTSVTVSSNGLITGDGTVGDVNGTGGIVTAGTSGTGKFTVGNLSMATPTHFPQQMNSATDYRQLLTNGTVSLGNAIMAPVTFNTGYTPTPGTVFTILKNNANSPISGILTGLLHDTDNPSEIVPLGEGTCIVVSSVGLEISYQGGAGNDVTLTANGCNATALGTTTTATPTTAAPTTVSTTPPRPLVSGPQLPITGSRSSLPATALAMVLISMGGSMVAVSRRRPAFAFESRGSHSSSRSGARGRGKGRHSSGAMTFTSNGRAKWQRAAEGSVSFERGGLKCNCLLGSGREGRFSACAKCR